MPDKKKTSDDLDLPEEHIEDTAPPDEPQGDGDADPQAISDVETVEEPADDTAPDLAEAEFVEAETIAEETPEPVASEDQPPDVPVHSQTVSQPEPAPVVIRKGGFFPLLLGGVVAAAVGFGLARFGVPEGWPIAGGATTDTLRTELSARIEAQDGMIADLSGKLIALENAPAPESPDLSPQIEDLSSRMDGLLARIDALEARPAASGGSFDADAALAETRAQIKQMQQALDEQRAHIATLTDEAAREEEAAQLSARQAMQRAALTQIQTAIDSGTGYAGALEDLVAAGQDVPQPLRDAAESGVASLAALQGSFPDLARDALRAARQEQGGGGLTGFLETQLGLRSLEPREGDDADAVLSRAEAALREGRLAEAVAGLAALPDSARSVLSGWIAQAQTRMATLSAAQDLSRALNTN